MSVNVAYIISQVSHSNLFEWTATMLDKKKYKLTFILMQEKETPFELFLRREKFNVYRIDFKTKFDIPTCTIHIRNILKKEKISIVHTHLFEAGLAGMAAAKLAGIPKRIHTRHDATIHHDFHPSAVKYDKIINGLSTHIIAITKNVKQILMEMENVPEYKISIIHHGFRLDEFDAVEEERKTALIQKYFPVEKPEKIIGVVSRFIEWKGIQYIIPAFAEVVKHHPGAHLVLANAQGPYEAEIEKLLEQLPKGSYTKIFFEKDIIALYHLFDVFVHVPVDAQSEAFGQVYIEAMAAGVPSIVTLSGIAPDYILNETNALVVPFRNSKVITEKIKLLFSDPELKKRLVKSAGDSISNEFSIERMIRELENCYDA
ncbi:MAG TPA: glycosyltransferase family 4 protein [Bacteroidia bacterium]|nr:glycosyltransferase family 4 protein [Bacteroidia bacterium]